LPNLDLPSVRTLVTRSPSRRTTTPSRSHPPPWQRHEHRHVTDPASLAGASIRSRPVLSRATLTGPSLHDRYATLDSPARSQTAAWIEGKPENW